MQTENYRNWLEDQGYQYGTIATQMCRANRVEEHYGVLDELYKNDGFKSLISELTYTAKDKSYGKPNETKIPFKGDTYTNLASYKNAVQFYKKFLKDESVVPAPEVTEESDVEPAPIQAINPERNRVNLQALTEKGLLQLQIRITSELIRREAART